MKTKKIATTWIIFLIVMLPVSFAQQVSPGSDQPISIDARIPRYAGSERIDISGTTEPDTKLFLYVNGAKQRKFDPSPSGNFSFPSVELSVFEDPNIVEIEAEKAGVTSKRTYQVTVDNVDPEITLEKIPGANSEGRVDIKGNVSETARITIKVNNETIQELTADSFDQEITIQEGGNNLTIIAEDNAGNQAIKKGKVYMDTTPPDITGITPDSGAFFYETDPITDIEGKTEPFSKVSLYLGGSPENTKPDEETTADEEGNFIFQDVNIEGGYAAAGRAGYIGISGSTEDDPGSEHLPKDPQDIYEEAEIDASRKQEETRVDVFLVAEDPVGLKTQEQMTYTVGTCFSGNMDWNIMNLVEYQSPNTISPERLAEGTELATFILNISYQGIGAKPKIKDVHFERACDATSTQDERYNIGCRVLPNSPIVQGNDAKTTWYVRYDLNQLEGMDNFSEDLWEDLTRQFILPLKIRIDYSHEIRGKEEPGFQTQCMNIAYNVDTSRIDPRDVLPDWLLNDGMENINKTVTKLNDIISSVEKIMRYAGIACIVGFSLKVVTTIYRRWQSWTNYFQDRADTTKQKNEKCPVPGKNFNPENEGDKRTQADLSNQELSKRCPISHSAWESEANAYKAFRWACDRFLCHGTPARWTEQSVSVEGRAKTDGDDTVWQKIRNGLQCTERTGTKGVILRENRECTQKIGKQCFDYEGKAYAFTGQSPEEKDGELYYSLKPVNEDTGVIRIGKELEVIKNKNSVMLEKPSEEDCKKICKEKNFETGTCIDPQSFTRDKAKDDLENKIFANTKDCIKDRKVCYCSTKRDKEEIENIPEDDDGRWDYRYQKLDRVHYSPYVYYKGRDESACFGQNNWIFASSPYLDPADTIPAFQCVCTSQVRNRLVLLRNILSGLYNCFKQIEKTGRADAGVCKEIFTQYVCKWVSRLITYFAKGCVPWKGTEGESAQIGDLLQQGTDSIFGGIEESTNDLMDEYNNVALRDYLGLSETSITEKICLFAITGDWGFDFEGLMDAAYSTPFHTSATAFPADREYLTWNPENQQATYEYKTAWMIAPGCNIDSYSVELACVTDYELNTFDGVACSVADRGEGDDISDSGCDCTSFAGSMVEQARAGPSTIIHRDRGLSQGAFTDDSKHVIKESPYRYDHVKIRLNVNDPKLAEACFPKENIINQRSAVFYTPIHDATTTDILACRFDQSTGTFVCDEGGLLWDLRGRASFSRIELEEKAYLGEPLVIEKIPVKVSGKKQCLYIEAKNQFGGTVGRPINMRLDPDEEDPKKMKLIEKEEVVYLDEITAEDFGKYDDRVKVTSGSSSDYDYGTHFTRVKEHDGVIRDGSHDVLFKDETDDKMETATHINIDGSWERLTPRFYRIPSDGMAFTFNNVVVPEDSSCSGVSAPCKKYTFRITKGRARSVKEPQEWRLHLEIRHAPGEQNQGSCQQSIEEDLIIGTEKNFDITAYPFTRDDLEVCENRYGEEMNQDRCDCDADGTIDEEEDCTGDSNGNGKIDEEENGFCYKKEDSYSCSSIRKCNTGTDINREECDCNLNGEPGDKEGNQCKDKYCWTDGTCRNTSQAIEDIEKERSPDPEFESVSILHGSIETTLSNNEKVKLEKGTNYDIKIIPTSSDVTLKVTSNLLHDNSQYSVEHSVKIGTIEDLKVKEEEVFTITASNKHGKEKEFTFTVKPE